MTNPAREVAAYWLSDRVEALTGFAWSIATTSYFFIFLPLSATLAHVLLLG